MRAVRFLPIFFQFIHIKLTAQEEVSLELRDNQVSLIQLLALLMTLNHGGMFNLSYSCIGRSS